MELLAGLILIILLILLVKGAVFLFSLSFFQLLGLVVVVLFLGFIVIMSVEDKK